jgi:transcriptional regulator with XRE-family HTH domain
MAAKLKIQCDIRATLATAFRNWRLENNVPLKQVAVDLGVSISTVNTWESGKRFPSGRHFEMLVGYLGLPPCQLFCVVKDKCVPAQCLQALPKK